MLGIGSIWTLLWPPDCQLLKILLMGLATTDEPEELQPRLRLIRLTSEHGAEIVEK